MQNDSNYFIKRNKDNTLRLKRALLGLPYYVNEFFLGVESQTTPLTRLGYVQDLKIFFNFLVNELPNFSGKTVKDVTLSDLNTIKAQDLEVFLNYLNLYEYNGKTYMNSANSKARKLSTVRSFFNYFFKRDKLNSNVCAKISNPKVKDKEIIRLEVDEVVKLLNQAENGVNLTKQQQGFHKHTSKRDFAMLSLFLGTGIRISECVGLNVDDIDFDNNAFTITRKGGNRVILYFSDEVAEPLKEYIEERSKIKDLDENEKALFLSLQKKRMGIRATEKLVKKYSAIAAPLKHITPHKLRSTYGTNLYRETKDIYIVADVLGHKDVNTTKKHYAAISEDIRREAATKVKLRGE
ncbi:MAG: tyrosine-type recombinase/integrase [Spirochaetales bacterium]